MSPSLSPEQQALVRAGIALNQVPYQAERTDSLVNVAHRVPRELLPGGDAYLRYLMALHRAYPGKSSRAIFQEAFGRQQRTVQYTLRNWVWTFHRQGTTVWALISGTGVAWEWDREGDPAEAFRIRGEVEMALLAHRVRLPSKEEVAAEIRRGQELAGLKGRR